MNLKLLLASALVVWPNVPASGAIFLSAVVDGYVQSATVTARTGRAGETRVFVGTKAGTIETYDRATGTRSTLLDISSQVVSDGEEGLIGLAFDPNYSTNGRYFVSINTRPDPAGPVYSEVRRYTDPSIATEAEARIFRTEQTIYSNHKGGWIGFQADGSLLLALGDGGGTNDPTGTGQNTADLLGSIVRINPNADDFPSDPNRNYGIPSGNLILPGAAPELYAYGLRNPFRNSVAPDGNLIIADVGQDSFEELDILSPGAANRNFGWSLREGDIATPIVGGSAPADYVAPAFSYDHSAGDKAIIGGYVYRGSLVPELFGKYVFGDQQSGRIWSIDYTGTGFIATSLTEIGVLPSISGFGETATGEILATAYGFAPSQGRVIEIQSTTPVPEAPIWAMLITGFGAIGWSLRQRRAGRDQSSLGFDCSWT